MYNRDKGQDANQEILQLLRKMNDKLDHIQGSGGRKTERESQDQDGSKATSMNVKYEQESIGGEQNEQNTMWNLTQIQYELSNELFAGLTKLKKVIHEGEKHANRAKGKYQK